MPHQLTQDHITDFCIRSTYFLDVFKKKKFIFLISHGKNKLNKFSKSCNIHVSRYVQYCERCIEIRIVLCAPCIVTSLSMCLCKAFENLLIYSKGSNICPMKYVSSANKANTSHEQLSFAHILVNSGKDHCCQCL